MWLWNQHVKPVNLTQCQPPFSMIVSKLFFLAHVIKESLVFGIFQNDLKKQTNKQTNKAIFQPLPKRPSLDPNYLKIYGPVSSLLNLSKITEKLLSNNCLVISTLTTFLIHISQPTELVTALKLLYWKLSTIFSLFLTMERFLSGLFLICLPHSITLTTKLSFLALSLPTVSVTRPLHGSDPI